ncbi:MULTISPECIES: nuclear transport factor 2 family protein [unclassified Oleiphilus]|uniref:nuclear transport factor 2 family protein n=2 Tax=Oleiphilus TaxID=141450 RepID=UPI0007C314B2|nr:MULTISPECIES: nuclear transport factor 2 family protein [unclassified Oleiphilus]KZY40174.1 hypothetical protein A3732_20410 [Oleiphilus sp. HI0050]KZY76767.1 hypothetical protein A3741_10580 [Oleiphilus sp. HI0069]KZY77989.1 hypothetical protein A3740_09060 [Oleiphilus sp. HI0068]KZZ30439.1 hypothetical protein A3755_14010 [Oleiphilus sp. HI0085]KZY60653.1 hypothetical protein A3735_00085 [Oleiphilus sp. HI0061]
MSVVVIKSETPANVVERFKHLFHTLDANNCDSGIIEAVYEPDVLFEDSFHRIEGVANFQGYCASLYQNLLSCQFTFHDQWVKDNDAMLNWTMKYAHPKLNKGRIITIEGASLIRFNDKVYYHRDYFDGGQLLYEHIPVMGKLIQTLKYFMK